MFPCRTRACRFAARGMIPLCVLLLAAVLAGGFASAVGSGQSQPSGSDERL
jgi:hypothetical protein